MYPEALCGSMLLEMIKMPSKQNIQAISKWQEDNTDLVRIRIRKMEHIPERIQLAIDAGKASSRQAYIINAILAALERDGIPEITED